MKNLRATAYRANLMTRRRYQYPLLLVLSAAFSIFGEGGAQAIIWNGADHPERGVTSVNGLTDQPGYFSNVRSMYNNTNSTRGTATYLANGWVITARHMVQQGQNYGVIGPSNQMNFYNGSNNYGTLTIAMPYSAEIALVRLPSAPSGMTELPSSVIYTGSSETNMLVQMGGYGYFGPIGGTVSTDAVFHRGYNIAWINGSSVSTQTDGEQRLKDLGLLETGAMPGDSGSPLFLLDGPDTSVGDWSQYKLGGILATSQGNSWGADSNYVRMGGFSQLIKDIVWGSGKSYQWARGIAGTFSWNNSTLNGDTTNGNNWSSSLSPTFPVGAGDIVKLGSGTGANNQTINLDQDITVGQLAIGCTNNGTGIQTLAAGGAFKLTFDGLSGPGMIIHNATSRNDVISAPIVIAGNGTLYTSNPSSYSLSISGSIVSGLGSGTQLLQHTSGDLVVSGNISNGSTGGTMAVEVDGGRLILSGNNTASGNMVLADGATLRLVANAGNISMVGGVPTSSALGNNPASGSTGFQLGYNDQGSVRIELRSDSSVAFAKTTTGNNSGNVTLNFDVNNVSAVSGSGPQNGTLTFAPAGETSRNGGKGLTTYNTTINASGGNGYTLAIDRITSYGSLLNISANSAKVQIGSIGETGSTTLNFSGATDTTVTGAISNSSGTLTLNKNGAGTLTLQGNNSYTGSTNVNQGQLIIDGGDLADVSTVNVASGASLQIISGTPILGNITGLGSTSVIGADTALSVSSIVQSSLTIGADAEFLASIPGEPLNANDLQTVPEPHTFVMLLIALATAAIVRKSTR